MNLIKARLAKLRTDDGLVEFRDGVELGKLYVVDLDSKERHWMRNFDFNVRHEKDIIRTQDGKWLPFECLELIG
jgi:hypothetical protein